jgi:hypothetical protein
VTTVYDNKNNGAPQIEQETIDVTGREKFIERQLRAKSF